MSVVAPVNDNIAAVQVDREVAAAAFPMIWYGPSGQVVKRIGDLAVANALSGTRCPGITVNGGDGGGTNDLRGRIWSDVADAVGGQSWCPGMYHLSATIMDRGRYGPLKHPASPFGTATFTVKP